ncbi:hypothetical protein HD597_006798 [Nonomuraea thailandensis]|uniref:Uncharacterized protein n=1 Tax=Nonomuraea thailandensis TaxID=1188745 RepID=A0A9X2GRX7_9ACTN|nr:hypothetical protein [Nonomuraea thailandensis]MCP2359778.1 hypothetical protein [Nonomuraea thailandensis]
MSRYTIPNPPDSPEDRVITVGWDAPLNTYWATAFDPPASIDGEDVEVFWIGYTPCELPDVESLATALRKHGVEIPPFTVEALRVDKPGEGESFAGRPATKLIAEMTRPYVPADQQARIDVALQGGGR